LISLKKNGLQTQGLFRLQGNRQKIADWKIIIDSGGEIRLTTDHHPHDVAGLLLLYFRSLPEGLIPESRWTVLLAEENFLFEMLIDVLQHLPQVSKLILLKLVNLLLLIAENCEINLMDTHNLATCLAPNIFRFNFIPAESESGTSGLKSELNPGVADWSAIDIIKKTNEIMEFMLENWQEIETRISLRDNNII